MREIPFSQLLYLPPGLRRLLFPLSLLGLLFALCLSPPPGHFISREEQSQGKSYAMYSSPGQEKLLPAPSQKNPGCKHTADWEQKSKTKYPSISGNFFSGQVPKITLFGKQTGMLNNNFLVRKNYFLYMIFNINLFMMLMLEWHKDRTFSLTLL